MSTEATTIKTYYPASASVADDVVSVAKSIGASPYALANMINFESRFSPTARNPISGATGLIQFMPKTAIALGTTTTALSMMSSKQQMPYVLKYLSPYAGRVSNPIDLYMAVFYPKAIGNPKYKFSANIVGTNSGISTPTDYANMVNKTAKLPSLDLPAELDDEPTTLPTSSIVNKTAMMWVAWGMFGVIGAVALSRALGFGTRAQIGDWRL